MKDLAALPRHSRTDRRPESLEPKEDSSAVITTETGDETTIPDPDEKSASGSFEDVRTEFVLQSVELLVRLEEDLMALVRYRGKNNGNTCWYGPFVSSSSDCRHEVAKIPINKCILSVPKIRDQRSCERPGVAGTHGSEDDTYHVGDYCLLGNISLSAARSWNAA